MAAAQQTSVALQEELTRAHSEMAAAQQTSVALKEELTRAHSEMAAAQQTSVALQEELTKTRSELADAATRERFVKDRLAVVDRMDKDEKDLADKVTALKLQLADLQTSASSASQGASSTSVEITDEVFPAAGDSANLTKVNRMCFR
jgi:predicted RNase H-like nuclease (RuvC/YqgF family)